MECNKEEAVRAKEIAVKKMENKDFVGARKAALMAQRLYSDLKDISQVILVCDVHCAAQNKVNGNEKDWYGILQVEPTVDEAAIKKQFRRLALLLHPDKNQFAGASDAFKFIGEAHKVLVDNQKRAVYDSKYKPFKTVQVSRRAAQQGSRQSHPWLHKNVVSNPSQPMNQQSEQPVLYTQTVRENKQPTFWTVCPFCSIKYQYYRDIVNRNIYCQNCKREFIAYETTTPNGANGIGLSKPENSQEQRTVNHGHFAAVKLSKPTNSPSKTQDQRSLYPENLQTDPSSGMAFTSDVNKEAKQNDNCRKRKTKTVNDKKKQNISAESCEIFETGGTTTNGHNIIFEEDGNNQLKQKSGYDAVKNPRGSAQFKQHAPHDQNLNGDDEVLKPSKRSKSSQFINPDVVRPQVDHVQEQTGLATDITKKHKEASLCRDVKASSTPEYFEYPTPDFNDFDELRRVGGFSPGQLWAVYDTLDGMPRFYALIKQVMSPGFKVRITWLEPHPDDEDKIKWLSVGLPTSCGKFRLGYTEDNEDHDMFSHLAHWERPNINNVYTIYPRKGETWAIFKNWDLNWYSTLVDKTNYKFEFVEVLSDYSDGVGVRVAYLAKITGFTSLYCRTIKEGRNSDVIPAEHLFKFSHKVPSFRMNGKEGKNVPAGSFELDPASLPLSHEGIEVLPNSNTDIREISMNGSSRSAVDILEAKNDVKQDGSSTAKPAVHASLSDRTQLEAKSKGKSRVVDQVIVEGSPSLSESEQLNGEYREKEHLTKEETEAMKIPQEVDLKFNDIASSSEAATLDEDLTVPDPDFNNFDANRTRDKFKVGQIWAIYCEEDALPRYYCIIRRIDSPPHFGIYLQWLTARAPSKGIIRWVDKRMTISCGNFRLGKKEALKYDNTDAFSHEVKVELIKEKNIHIILPRKGDVWALYKDWSKNLAHSDLKRFKYEVTEVLEKNETGVKVLFLERVRGLKSVFRPQTRRGSTVIMVIPMAEILRFSHQVPAVRLSEEREGRLRGFWEIDTASLPAYVFSSN